MSEVEEDDEDGENKKFILFYIEESVKLTTKFA